MTEKIMLNKLINIKYATNEAEQIGDTDRVLALEIDRAEIDKQLFGIGMKSQDMDSGREVKSPDMDSGREVKSQDMDSGREVKSQDMDSGYEVKSHDLNSGYEVKSQDMNSGHVDVHVYIVYTGIYIYKLIYRIFKKKRKIIFFS